MSAPSVSVVVPTRDRPLALRRCLLALAQLDHPPERLEVVVVDDGGTSDLSRVLPAPADGLRLRVLRQPHGGPARARNTGADAADGEILAFTDDDCAPARDWLRPLAGALASGPHVAVGGRTLNALTSNPFAAASQAVQDLVYAHYNADPTAARFVASNNLALHRVGFRAVGGFDGARFPGASEDRDLCDRWRAGGRRLVYDPSAVVWHYHDLSLGGFCRQHARYGRGAARFHAARQERGTGRLRDELGFHANSALWRAALGRGSPGRLALLALWQACNAAGYAAERARAARA